MLKVCESTSLHILQFPCVLIYFVHIVCDKHINYCLKFNSRTVTHAKDNKLYIYLDCIYFF